MLLRDNLLEISSISITYTYNLVYIKGSSVIVQTFGFTKPLHENNIVSHAIFSDT